MESSNNETQFDHINMHVDENSGPVPNFQYKKNIRYIPTDPSQSYNGTTMTTNRTALGDVTSQINNTRNNPYLSKIGKQYAATRNQFNNGSVNTSSNVQNYNQIPSNGLDANTGLYEEKPSTMDIDVNDTIDGNYNYHKISNNRDNNKTNTDDMNSSVLIHENIDIQNKDLNNKYTYIDDEEEKVLVVEEEEEDAGEEEEEEEENEEEEEDEEEEDDFYGKNYTNIRFGPVKTRDSAVEWNQAFAKYHRVTPDLMDEDTYDVTMAVEYCNDVMAHLLKLEQQLTPNENYILHQPDLKWKHRTALLNWLVEVHEKFNLLQETLYLAVNIMDRFLSHTEIALDKFHLVGATCLFIASKYEEINCIVLKDLLDILDNNYTDVQVIRAEKYILCSLQFELGWPGPMSFLRRISKADDYEYDIRTLAKYLLESTIMEPKFVASPPSWLAAGAYFLSMVILQKDLNLPDGVWSEKHVYYSGYTEKQITPAASLIAQNCRIPEIKHESIFKKYSQRRHRKCSQLVQNWLQDLEREN